MKAWRLEDLKNANKWEDESDKKIIRTQTANLSTSMHYELAFNDNVHLNKDTCIEQEYENERRFIEKYNTMVEVNLTDDEQIIIFSDIEEEEELSLSVLKHQYLDILEEINNTEEIVFNHRMSDSNYNRDQPKNVHIGAVDHEIHNNLKIN